MKADIFHGRLKVELFAQAIDNSGLICQVSEIWSAEASRRKDIQALNKRGRGRNVDLELFSPFFHEEIDIQAADEVVDDVTEFPYSCFLAHTWASEYASDGTHKQVVEIARELQRRQFKVWIDADCMGSYIAKSIVMGLKQSRKIVVFLTKIYMTRVDDGNTNAAKEFSSAMKKGIENIIVVVLESDLLNPTAWFGTVVDYHIGDALFIDFSTPHKMADNFDKLADAINA